MDFILNEKMIEKAKEAQSAEEILTLAKENGIEMSEEEAKEYFEQLHKTGELSDDELDNVAGGGCQVGVNGNNYTIVTSYCDCFTGNYLQNVFRTRDGDYSLRYTFDRRLLRTYWADHTRGNQCGDCAYLAFKEGTSTGYCALSKK